MRIACPACQAPIAAEDVHLPRALAKCRACDEVFGIANQLAEGLAEPPVPRAEQARPQGFRLERSGKGLRVTIPWRSWKLVPLAAFCLFWDGFMAFWFAVAISEGQWFMGLFGSLHALVGLAMTYGVLAGLINSTVVEVAQGRLRVRHGPLPSLTNHDLAATAVDQLYTCRSLRHGSEDAAASFDLMAIVQGKVHQKLLENVEEPEHALFLEQEIERFLGLPDRQVPGEIERIGNAFPAAADAPLQLGPVTRGEQTLCPVCREPLLGEPRACPSCAALHHPDCWDFAQGCSTFGCSLAPMRAPRGVGDPLRRR